jgi:hypothetical protein
MDVRNLPMAEPRTGLVAPPVEPRPISRAEHLRHARERADDIVLRHARVEGRGHATCPLCTVSYPCDAVRAAMDVIAISSEALELAEVRSSARA